MFPHGNHGNLCSCLESTHNVQESDHNIFKMVQKNEDRKDICGVLYFLFALALHSSSGWNTICIGERIEIIYDYIIKNFKI